ncbi:MAG: zinc-ribbon domain-containing protein [Deltaproteobacteria bacterium]|nr:zinc-ribbon domain-containing protein [Deltaproteobacteria bacterium]
MKFLCDQCKAKYQIADEKVQGKTLRMKCRKCGHVIEIRASVETTSTGETVQLAALSEEAAAAAIAQSTPPPAAKPAPAPSAKPGASAAPRPGAAQRPPGATTPRPSATATRPAAAPGKQTAPRAGDAAKSTSPPGALASAFSKQVATTTKIDAPAAAAPTGPDVPAEEWYVAIEEVPVGPIRLSELRAKYAQGAITDDSLVWREGYEEWRPLRTLTDLHTVVCEEVSGAHGPGRGSLLPNASGAAARPAARASGPAGGKTTSPRPAAAAPARGGNVIPFVQPRGAAAARKLDEDFDDEATQIAASPVLPPEPAAPVSAPQAKTVDDPFGFGALPAAPMAAPAAAASTVAISPNAPAPLADDVGRPTMMGRARGMSKGTVALIAAACVLLGVVVAVVAVKPKIVEKVIEKRVDVPVSVFVPAPSEATAAPTVAVVAPESSAAAPKVALKSGAPSAATVAAAGATAGSKKLGGLDMGPEGPSVGGPGGPSIGGGQPLEGKAVESVIASKRVAVRKVCFEPWSDKGSASVKITLKIGPDGKVQSSDIASTSGEPAIGQCVQRMSKGWTFPSSESGGTFNVPFLFGT